MDNPRDNQEKRIEKHQYILSSLKSGQVPKATQDPDLKFQSNDGVIHQFHGHRLRVLKAFYNISTKEVSAIIDVYPEYVTKIERNLLVPTNLEHQILCEYFDVPEDFFRSEQVYLVITNQTKLKVT